MSLQRRVRCHMLPCGQANRQLDILLNSNAQPYIYYRRIGMHAPLKLHSSNIDQPWEVVSSLPNAISSSIYKLFFYERTLDSHVCYQNDLVGDYLFLLLFPIVYGSINTTTLTVIMLKGHNGLGNTQSPSTVE